ncbi:PLDc N-terminal domain-containing protein [Nanoarchaeota archaeon]
MVFGSIVGIIALACAIWVIYDVIAKNKKLSTGIKVLWIVLALFFSIITAIVYYFVEKK